MVLGWLALKSLGSTGLYKVSFVLKNCVDSNSRV
jgi:hypothetical protein